MKRFFNCLLFVFISSVFFNTLVAQTNKSVSNKKERILNYYVDLTLEESGLLTVHETIKVFSNGEKIKRGIFRKLPNYHKDKYGDDKKVNYSIDQVKHNGAEAIYHRSSNKDFGIIKIGEKGVFLDAGEHTYEVIYTVDNQVSFFENYDELYWNVTGSYWSFSIDKITARLILPKYADVNKNLCYTGPKGSTASECTIEAKNDTIIFKNTKGLNVQHGLTIASQFSKNAVIEPVKINTFTLLHWKKMALPTLVYIGLLIFIWVVTNGFFYKKTYYPNFEIPKDISPVTARYLLSGKLDNISFLAQLVSLKVKNAISITSKDKVTKITNNIALNLELLSKGEKNAYDELFKFSDFPIKLSFKRDIRLVNAKIIGLETIKEEAFKLGYFKKKWLYAVVVVLVSILFIVYTGLNFFPEQYYEDILPSFFAMPFICILAIPFLFYTNGAVKVFSIIFFSIVFLFIWFTPMPFQYTLLIPITISVVSWLYIKRLRVYTKKGAHKRAEIKGLQLFLTVAEAKRFEHFDTMGEKLEVFERFLPYAIALGLKSNWLKQFDNIIDSMSEDLSQIVTKTDSISYQLKKTSYSNTSYSTSSSSHTSSSSSSSYRSSNNGSSGGGSGGGGGGGW